MKHFKAAGAPTTLSLDIGDILPTDEPVRVLVRPSDVAEREIAALAALGEAMDADLARNGQCSRTERGSRAG